MDSDYVAYAKEKLARGSIPRGMEEASLYAQAAMLFNWPPEVVDRIPYTLLFQMLLIGQAIYEKLGEATKQ